MHYKYSAGHMRFYKKKPYTTIATAGVLAVNLYYIKAHAKVFDLILSRVLLCQ